MWLVKASERTQPRDANAPLARLPKQFVNSSAKFWKQLTFGEMTPAHTASGLKVNIIIKYEISKRLC